MRFKQIIEGWHERGQEWRMSEAAKQQDLYEGRKSKEHDTNEFAVIKREQLIACGRVALLPDDYRHLTDKARQITLEFAAIRINDEPNC